MRQREKDRIAKIKREFEHKKRRWQIANVKAGLPANGLPPKKKLSGDALVAHLREQIKTLVGFLDDMPQGHGRRVMSEDLEAARRELRGLTGHPKKRDAYATRSIERQTIK